jgi:choline dehydrogenase-like flavoprotein
MESLFKSLFLESVHGKSDQSMVEALIDYVRGLQQRSSSSNSDSSSDDGHFKFIIVGTGMGGGAVARMLIENQQKVLVIERGKTEFLTHCLNTSRPHFEHENQKAPGRDNELLYNMLPGKWDLAPSDSSQSSPEDPDPSSCGGKPWYGIGGRSLFWSLETPEIGKDVAKANFPSEIADSLWDTADQQVGIDDLPGHSGSTITVHGKEGWYTKAARLLANSPPGDLAYASTRDDIKTAEAKLNNAVKNFAQDQAVAVPQGAEFTDGSQLYYFPQGAYSTADWLVDQMYKKDKPSKIVCGVEVVNFSLNEDGDTVEQLTLRDSEGIHNLPVDPRTKVVLCAGTVNTAAIALRSGKKRKADFQKNHKFVGQGLTDHEIWMAKYSKRITPEQVGEQPLELSCNVKVNGNPALLTICIHAEKFYGHGFATGEANPEPKKSDLFNVLNVMLEFEAPLNESGEVILSGSGFTSVLDTKPLLQIKRKRLDSSPAFDHQLKEIVKSVRTTFDFEGVDEPQLAKWGSVAHEVGTMRMDRPNHSGGLDKGVVDSDLRVHDVKNLYVCDLSVFPLSPTANPSKTLTALAMRLADHLVNIGDEDDKKVSFSLLSFGVTLTDGRNE